MKSIKVCEYSRSRSFHDDLILQDQASGERSQDQWSSGFEGEGDKYTGILCSSFHLIGNISLDGYIQGFSDELEPIRFYGDIQNDL